MIEELIERIQKCVEERDTVLDLGCGIMGITKNLKCKSVLGVDAWYPYLDSVKETQNVLCMPINKDTVSYFVNDSFDVVTMLDFVEHFEKEEAFNVIKHAERIARKKIIIFTPEGFLEQEDSLSWGKGNPKYQKHRCGFTSQELEMMGYEIKKFPTKHDGKDIVMLLGVKDLK
ncbi:MAG: class I SAM-dependent methyltransferase [archaeon]